MRGTCLEYGKPWAYSVWRASFRAVWMDREVSDSVGQKVWCIVHGFGFLFSVHQWNSQSDVWFTNPQCTDMIELQ